MITTILGAAPGAISEMSLVESEYGVGATVATLHAVSLITVLFNSFSICEMLELIRTNKI